MAGKLDKKQQAEWEAFFNENPFEKEAIEGLQMLSAEELENDLQELKQKINPSNQIRIFSYRAIAASVAILLSCIVLALYFTKSPEINPSMSFEKSTPEKKLNPKAAEETTPSPQNTDLQGKEISRNEDLLLKKQSNEIQNSRNEKPLTLKNIETENQQQLKGIIKNEEAEELIEAESSVDNKKKLEEQNLPELNRDRIVEGNRKNNQEVQVERKQEAGAYNNKKENNPKLKRYATSPQESRALNTTKDDAYQAPSILLQGQVFEKKSKKALKGVKIFVEEHRLSSQTDSLGKFMLNLPISEKYTLTFELLGYESLTTQAKPNEKNTFYLKKK